MRTQVQRGSAMTVLLAIITTGSLAALGVYTATPSGSTTTTGIPLAKRKTPPIEIGTVLTLVGITPESLAAAGVTLGECEGVFDTANVYCLQADRLDELRVAFGNLNEAKQRAADGGEEGQLTIAQAQIAVDNIVGSGFTFVTSLLVPDQTDRLSQIKANSFWSPIPAPYRTISRTRQEWLGLRAAFWSKQTAERNGRELSETLAQRISDAGSDSTVATALENTASRLESIKQLWDTRFH